MYAEYAKDPRMRRNVGISPAAVPAARQRPSDVAELFHAMLFSMPGSPVLYYGDEIGMGDNIYLGDRDGVRTPMQWTPDRNAGFSTRRLRPALPAAADGPGLRLPGRQRRGRSSATRRSFLHWLRRHARGPPRSTRCSASARFEVLHADNPSVLAYLRRVDDEDGRGHRPVRQQPQPVRPAVRADARAARRQGARRADGPGAVPAHRRAAVLRHPRRPTASTGSASVDAGEERRRDRRSTTSSCVAAARLPRRASAGRRRRRRADRASSVVDWHERARRRRARACVWVLVDAPGDDGAALPGVRRRCRPLDRSTDVPRGQGPSAASATSTATTAGPAGLRRPGRPRPRRSRARPGRRPTIEVERAARPSCVEQSNSSVVVRRAADPQVFRRVAAGPEPRRRDHRGARRAGLRRTCCRRSASWRRDGTRPGRRCASSSSAAPTAGTWRAPRCATCYDRRARRPRSAAATSRPTPTGSAASSPSCTWRWPRRSAPRPGDPAAWADEHGRPASTSSATAERRRRRRRRARAATSALRRPRRRRARPSASTATSTSARCMRTDAGWFVLDFEGEPAAPAATSAGTPSSPLRDVAGMLRSFHYAAASGAARAATSRDDELHALADGVGGPQPRGLPRRLPRRAEASTRCCRPTTAAAHVVLGAFELDKAVYEVGYELAHRPDWVHIPSPPSRGSWSVMLA